MLTAPDDGHITDQDAAPVMHAVAEKLHERGIEVRWPKYRDSRRLAIVNARDARSEITAEDCGYVTWDYWPGAGAGSEAGDVTATVLDVLGARGTRPVPAVRGTLTLKGAVGRALKARACT
jgi:hypothetical protein